MTSDQFEILLEFYNATTRRKPSEERMTLVKRCFIDGIEPTQARVKLICNEFEGKAILLRAWGEIDHLIVGGGGKALLMARYSSGRALGISVDDIKDILTGDSKGIHPSSVKHVLKRAKMITDYANRYNAAKVKAG